MKELYTADLIQMINDMRHALEDAGQEDTAAFYGRKLWQLTKPDGISPFSSGYLDHPEIETVDVNGRLQAVKKMGMAQLRAVITYPGSQKTVRKAAMSRLRKLERS